VRPQMHHGRRQFQAGNGGQLQRPQRWQRDIRGLPLIHRQDEFEVLKHRLGFEFLRVVDFGLGSTELDRVLRQTLFEFLIDGEQVLACKRHPQGQGAYGCDLFDRHV
jgi:hypothetical protein